MYQKHSTLFSFWRNPFWIPQISVTINLHHSKILEYTFYNQLPLCPSKNYLQDPNQSGSKVVHTTESLWHVKLMKLQAARSVISPHPPWLFRSIWDCTLQDVYSCSSSQVFRIWGVAWQWIPSYLEGQSYQVIWSGFTPDPHRLSTGVSKGSVHSPLLFSLHTWSLT